MADKKPDPGADPKKPGADAGPKKPYATIDLKATEVKTGSTAATSASAPDKDAKPASDTASKPAGSGPAAASVTPVKSGATGSSAIPTTPIGTGSTTASAAAGSAGKPASATAADKPGAKPTASAASAAGAAASATAGKGETKDAKSGPGGSSGAGSKSPPPPPPPRKSGGSAIGRFFSLLLAGLVGGFLALLGADTLKPQIAKLAPQIGLPSDALQGEQKTAKLEQRLATLEEALSKARETQPPVAQITQQIEATQSRLKELDDLKASLDEVRSNQAQLGETAATLTERLAQAPQGEGEGGVSTERLAKLEQQFQTLTSAAGQNPDASSLPELAAISGRIADLESALQTQISALQQNVSNDVDKRISAVAETSQQAQSAAQRIDRQLATATTEAARLGQRMEALKADGDRISDTLRVVQEETGQLRSSLDALKGDIEAKLGKVARPADIEQAIGPVAQKLTTLESDVANVVEAEKDRKANAQRIVLSLELANLKRAIDYGDSYKEPLGAVQEAANGVLDLSDLTKYESTGVSTLSELETSFKPVIAKVLKAAEKPEEGSVFDQLLAGAKSVVRVRRVDYAADDSSAEAIVARMEKALAQGRLGAVLEEAKKLEGSAAKEASGWLEKVEARHAVDVALAKVEDQLKSSLGGGNAG